MPRTLGPALAGALAVVLVATGCGGYDRDAYCAAVRDVRQPAALGDAVPGDDTMGPASPETEDDAALRAYLEQVRALEDLAPREDEGSWRTLREGLESVMTDGAVDVDKVEQAQRELTLMAQAAEELDTRLLSECGVGLSAG
jgi:hypothetical protein